MSRRPPSTVAGSLLRGADVGNLILSDADWEYLTGELAIPEYSRFYLPTSMSGPWLAGFDVTIERGA